jgi:hypothetical protein
MARRCHACHREAELLRYTTYGSLCRECFAVATKMESLVTSWDKGASNDLKTVIRQLRRLARQLQSRSADQNNTQQAAK